MDDKKRPMIQWEDKIYDLTDVIEEDPENVLPVKTLDNKLIERISGISERVAREMFPWIAERIIREEIEKLKRHMEDPDV